MGFFFVFFSFVVSKREREREREIPSLLVTLSLSPPSLLSRSLYISAFSSFIRVGSSVNAAAAGASRLNAPDTDTALFLTGGRGKLAFLTPNSLRFTATGCRLAFVRRQEESKKETKDRKRESAHVSSTKLICCVCVCVCVLLVTFGVERWEREKARSFFQPQTRTAAD